MYDIVFVSKNLNSPAWQSLKSHYPLAKRVDSFEKSQQIALTEFFWLVPDDVIVKDFNFDYTPDDWSKDVVHVFKNGTSYDGIVLVPKYAAITNKEVEHRFYIHKKEVDIVASIPMTYDVFEIDSYNDYLSALENSTTEMFWMSSANILPNLDLINTFYLSHHERQLRTQTHAFVHSVNEQSLYNGLFLCSKQRILSKQEVEYRFPVNRIEHDTVGSGPKTYDIFTIDSYEDYLNAYDNTTTEMFWATSNNIKIDNDFQFDIYFSHENSYDRLLNHVFAHRVTGTDLYNGLFLLSKHVPLTKREIEHRYIVTRKEWDIVASGPCQYEMFYPTNYEDYLTALKTSKTEMFWIIPDYVNPTNRFKFDTYFTHDEQYNRTINHAYLNGKYHDGIVLCSKQAKFSRREFDYKFIAAKKEVDVVISTPNPYDIVFISYQEPNADENYNKLLKRFPRVKRVHGVKGIHQAHIEAAKLCNTYMFWIVDGDATIVDDFKFDYQVARWDKEVVHVWRSQNPINDMVYGYGGVKLFPTELTIDMDTGKPDMTTSISSKFRAVHDISNITGFNTDPFNTWKSAFRECTKLASKVIDRQKDDETAERLRIWTTVGKDRQFGKHAIAGARAGAAYGAANQGNIAALKMINDFDWLKEKFDANI